MKANEDLINRFYTAFQNKEYSKMQGCYAENAHFSDPVFPNLDAKKVGAMWEMFCKSGENLFIQYEILHSTDATVDARWTAKYTFSGTGNQVLNVIDAHFIIEEGQILQHTDQFDFYNWARQALGLPGLLLGWTSYLKKTVRKQGAKALYKFMKNQSESK